MGAGRMDRIGRIIRIKNRIDRMNWMGRIGAGWIRRVGILNISRDHSNLSKIHHFYPILQLFKTKCI
jgi:hypothetical protein